MSSDPGINYPYRRRMVLEFGNFSDRASKIYESTGDMKTLRAIARIQKTISGVPSAAQITLYNLSEDTRSFFSDAVSKGSVKDRPTIRIKAGWDNGPKAGLIETYYGNILTAESYRTGTDIVTAIQSLSFVGNITNTKINKPWTGNVSVVEAIKFIAKSIYGVDVEESRIKGITSSFGSGGWTASGTAKSELDKLASAFGFSWNVIDGKFQAIADDDGFGTVAVIKDPELSSVNPYIGCLALPALGISWECLFDASLCPGRYARLESKLSSRYNGTYRLNMVNHDLDCYSEGGGFKTNVVARMDGKIA